MKNFLKRCYRIAIILFAFLFFIFHINNASAQDVGTKATIEPFLTVILTGLNDGANITAKNPACLGSDKTNTGSQATSTHVNLGYLKNGNINISAQQLSVSTNVKTGYSITATSSGRLRDIKTGSFIADAGGKKGLTANNTPAPAVFPGKGSEFFGIHACGDDTDTNLWGNAATKFNSGAKYLNPWNSEANNYYALLASFKSPASARKTIVEYGATVGPNTLGGLYSTDITYVITVNF